MEFNSELVLPSLWLLMSSSTFWCSSGKISLQIDFYLYFPDSGTVLFDIQLFCPGC
jgi:hypothetical protein